VTNLAIPMVLGQSNVGRATSSNQYFVSWASMPCGYRANANKVLVDLILTEDFVWRQD
jgi:hypothetical protein